MHKSTRIIWTIMFVWLLLLLAGCSDPIEHTDEQLESSRDFIISDKFPYPGKKSDSTVLNKPINFTYSIYIYVVNKGGNWTTNDVRNIQVRYYDTTRGVSVEYTPIFPLRHNNRTYIRVDNISYPWDARGYFRVEGEIRQGNRWHVKSANSNLFNYGNPGITPPPPLNRDFILYEKEYVD